MNKIEALNDIVTSLGGTGGYKYEIQALNAWAVLVGAAGGYKYEIQALNAIDKAKGGTGLHKYNIDALNSICKAAGGSGVNKYDIDALVFIGSNVNQTLSWNTDQSTRTNVVINSLVIAAGKTVNIDWGDGTNADYTGSNTNITKTYAASAVTVFDITISGDIDAITTLSHYNQRKSYGNLTSWRIPAGLTAIRLSSCSFTGDLSGWVVPSGAISYLLHDNQFTGNLGNKAFNAATTTVSLHTNQFSGDASGLDLDFSPNLSIINLKACKLTDAPVSKSTKLTLYDISDNYIDGLSLDRIIKDLADFYEVNAPTVNAAFNIDGSEMGTLTGGVNNPDLVRLKGYYTAASKTATCTINALEVVTGSASGTYVDDTITYASSIDDITDLYAVTSYDSGFTANLPIVCFGHGFGGDADTITLAQMHEYAAQGFFVLNIGMRGRNSAGGDKDASGREIYDIYDAVEYVKANIARTSKTKVAWSGFSGGGGNGMNLACKIPDLCTVIASHWGVSDYGEDATTGWWQQVSGSRSAIENQVGGTPSIVPNNYKARNARRSLFQTFRGWLYLFHGSADASVPPSQSQLIYDTFTNNGKLNATLDINSYTHQNFNGTTLSDFSADIHNREAWKAPLIGSCQIIGFLKTKRFEVQLGNMDNHVANLVYDVNKKLFTITPLTGEVEVTVIFGTTQTEIISGVTTFDFN